MKHPLVLTLFLALPLLWSCSPLLGETPTADQHLARAESLVEQRDYRAAATALDRAIRQRPGDGALYLRHGELLEVAGLPEPAAKTYREALATIPANEPSRPELSYRLILVHALKLATPAEAAASLSALPVGSPRYVDAQGCLAYGAGRHQDALRLFEKAREAAREQDLLARTLYHSALAYRQLGDVDLTKLALFHAINQARSLGVRKDIEAFFSQLQEPTP